MDRACLLAPAGAQRLGVPHPGSLAFSEASGAPLPPPPGRLALPLTISAAGTVDGSGLGSSLEWTGHGPLLLLFLLALLTCCILSQLGEVLERLSVIRAVHPDVLLRSIWPQVSPLHLARAALKAPFRPTGRRCQTEARTEKWAGAAGTDSLGKRPNETHEQVQRTRESLGPSWRSVAMLEPGGEQGRGGRAAQLGSSTCSRR